MSAPDPANQGSGAGAVALVGIVVALIAMFGGCSVTNIEGGAELGQAPVAVNVQTVAATTGMPAAYAAAYQTAAANRPNGCPVDAALLAAVGWQETKWGTWGVGPDGLIKGLVGEDGPMQFTQATWSDYGAGGSPHNIHDAAMAAMRLLCSVNGDTTDRLWRYNQSAEYGAAVQQKAAELEGKI